MPRYLVTVRFIDIPSVDESEIEKMVEFQAIKEIPYPKEDMIISYKNLGSYKEGFSSIMLVIARRQTIEEKMRAMGQKVAAIRLHSELLYLYLLKKGIMNPDRVTLIVHIGGDDSEIIVVDKTQPNFSRGFKNSDRFFEEIDRSVLAYTRGKDKPRIENIIVAYSSDIDIEDAKPHIKEYFSGPINFYEYSDDLSNVDLAAEIDLLPKEISHKKASLQKKQEVLVTCSLVGFIAILTFAFLSFKIYDKNKFLGILSSKIDQMQAKTNRLEKLVKKTEVVKKLLKQGSSVIDILKPSYDLIPADISLSGLSYDGVKNIYYKGTSKGMSDIFSFVKKLEESKYFKKVEVKYATRKKVKGEEFIDFNIRCQIKD